MLFVFKILPHGHHWGIVLVTQYCLVEECIEGDYLYSSYYINDILIPKSSTL